MTNVLRWDEGAGPRTAAWRSDTGARPPTRVIVGDDRLRADRAYRLACEGTAVLWRGDFHNARQLLTALGRRVDRKNARASSDLTAAFHQQRRDRHRKARVLGMVLVAVEPGCVIPLRRAPDARQAMLAAGCPADEGFVVSLRELQGMIGAHEWRRRGVHVPALDASIVAHYGVFSPVRGEYVDLVARAALPGADSAIDVGTGTGVLAAVLARRGIGRVIATDDSDRALGCARDNVERLGLAEVVTVQRADLFPPGGERVSLAVCNPPWLPGRPTSPLESAIYDPNSRMVRHYLRLLPANLLPGGEGWLIMSDLAELLGLRSRDELSDMIASAGLRVVDRLDTRPTHARAADPDDPLYRARAAEVTSLWRLAPS